MDLSQGEVYSFNTIADEVLGEHTNVRLVGIGGLLITEVTGIDVMNLGDRVVAASGPSTIDMADKRFFIFKDVASGELSVVAEDWVVSSTVRLTEGNSYLIRLQNMPSDQLSHISDAIRPLLPRGVTMTISST